MSRTADGAARSIEHDEQPPERGQELEDQLSQEQFNDELQKDLEVMLTQEELCEEEGDQREEKEEERLMKAKKRMMMRVMPRTRKGDIQVLISLQLNLDEGQRRTNWTRILTRTTR